MICLIILLLIWSISGIIWTAVSTHEWHDRIDPIIAGPFYWALALLYALKIIDFTDHYGEDEELDVV